MLRLAYTFSYLKLYYFVTRHSTNLNCGSRSSPDPINSSYNPFALSRLTFAQYRTLSRILKMLVRHRGSEHETHITHAKHSNPKITVCPMKNPGP